MSRAGKDNVGLFDRMKLNRENKKAAAAGNMSVESAKGGGKEEPQMRSVNEKVGQDIVNRAQAMNHKEMIAPSTAAPQQLLTNKKIADTRNKAKEEEKLAQQVALQRAQQEGLLLPAAERTVKTKQTAPVNLKSRVVQQYDKEDAIKRMAADNWLVALKKQVEDDNEAARLKAEEASKYAKTQAWGNMFRALGQLAGVGKNTYVKPENKYLTEALSKTDKAREVYEALKKSNKEAIKNAENKWLEADKAAFDQRLKLINEGIDKENELAIKMALANTVENTAKYNNSDYYNQENLKLKGRQVAAQEKTAQANADRAAAYVEGKAGGNKKDPFLKQEINGYTYSGDKADAGALAQIMRAVGWTGNGLLDTQALNLMLSGNVENVDPLSFNRLAAAFLSDEKNLKIREVRDFLNRLKTDKVTLNNNFPTDWSGFPGA